MCKDLLPAAWPWLTQHTANPSTAQHAVCCTSEQKPKENNQLFTSIVDNFCKVQPCLGLVFNCKWIVYLRINFTILNRELIMTLSSWLDVHVINNQINKINNREDIQYYSRNTVLRECRRGSSVGYLSSNTVYNRTQWILIWMKRHLRPRISKGHNHLPYPLPPLLVNPLSDTSCMEHLNLWHE